MVERELTDHGAVGRGEEFFGLDIVQRMAAFASGKPGSVQRDERQWGRSRMSQREPGGETERRQQNLHTVTVTGAW